MATSLTLAIRRDVSCLERECLHQVIIFVCISASSMPWRPQVKAM